jgi:hypothetical protein
VDAVVWRVRIEVPWEPGVIETIAGLNEAVKPAAEGDTVAVILMLSVRPKLFRVTVDVAVLPATTLAGLGAVALIEKSPATVTVNTTE